MSDQNQPAPGGRPIPAAWAENPFKAPAAHVDDVRVGGDGGLAAEPAAVESGRGSGWWGDGWSLFREATGTWIGITVVLLILSVALTAIPIVGLVSYLLFPVLTGGLMLGCRAIDQGEGLSFGHLFAGFQNHFGQLALIGACYLGGLAAIGIVAFFIGLGGGLAGNSGPAVAIAVLLGALAAIPLAMAIWFAPALVAINGLGATEAMKLSFRGCRRNMLPFLLWGVIAVVLAVLATLPLALGWLVLVPAMIASTYVAYKDIFLA